MRMLVVPYSPTVVLRMPNPLCWRGVLGSTMYMYMLYCTIPTGDYLLAEWLTDNSLYSDHVRRGLLILIRRERELLESSTGMP